MFDMFDLFISLHHYILMFMCTCLYPRILTSSYPQVRVCLLVTSYTHILLSLGSCTLSACWYPHVLISLGSCTPGACWYPRILAPSYIFRFTYSWCLLVSLHHHILISLGSCTLGACWYPRILTSSYP